MPTITVIGLGNPLMKDEGVGVQLVKHLQQRFEQKGQQQVAKQGISITQPHTFEFLDLGTSGFKVLHAIAHQQKVVILDCAFMGERPGTLRRFTPGDITTKKELKLFSLHEGDLLEILELSQRLGEYPSEVIIYGIEPKEIIVGNRLSQELLSKVEAYVETIEQDLLLK